MQRPKALDALYISLDFLERWSFRNFTGKDFFSFARVFIKNQFSFLRNFLIFSKREKKKLKKELEIELNRSQRALKTEWIVMNGFV